MTDKNPEPVTVEEVDDEEIRSRKDRPTGSIHFGDSDFDVPDEYGDATWGEVYQACCVHTGEEWMWVGIGILLVIFFLYFFLFGLELLGSGSKVLTGCSAGGLFGDDMNPVAAAMVGIIATVMFQSSSTTTSITVSMVGANSISLEQGIYIIMGSNIGTSVTSSLVAMGQMGDGDALERAFAGATVHDMFNFLTVAILLPVEWITGLLKHLTKAMTRKATLKQGDDWEGPIKKLVSPLADKIIRSNGNVARDIANGRINPDTNTTVDCSYGGGFYPIRCENPSNPTQKTCKPGLIACVRKTNKCPAFFQVDATAKDDKVSGGVCFFIALMILFFCLAGLVTILQKMLLGMSTRIIYKATNINGYLAIIIGAGVTMLVQSSSITTSTLTPLVGLGALRLEQMFPLTLGANIGTTITGLLAAMVASRIQALQTALAHLFFNIIGILIWYPIPQMRAIPLYAARRLGKATRLWRGFPILYIVVMFLLVPAALLGVSMLFEDGAKGYTVLGSFLVVIIALGMGWFAYYWVKQGGRENCVACFENRERRRVMMVDLPDDMEFLKAKIAALIEHTGLPEDGEDVAGEHGALKEKEEEVAA